MLYRKLTEAGKDEGDGRHAEELGAGAKEHRQQHSLPEQ